MTQATSVSRTGAQALPGPGVGWRVAIGAVALALGLFGLALFGGGVYLIALGGSWYYALAGAGSTVCAVLLVMQRRSALHLFALIWSLTVVWALWEVGLDGWGLVPRLVTMSVILLLLLLLSPALRRAPRRTA